MMYFYRLKDNKQSATRDSRSIFGIILHKKRWFISEDKINWGEFANLVEEKQAESTKEFSHRESLEVQNHRDKIRRLAPAHRIVPQPVLTPPQPVEEPKPPTSPIEETPPIVPESKEMKEKPERAPLKKKVIEPKEEPTLVEELKEVEESEIKKLSKAKIKRMKKAELKEALKQIGIPEVEYSDLKVDSLRELLNLTQEIEDV